MADLVSGGVVGALFGELFVAVKEAISTVKMFRPRLVSIQLTLNSLKPQIEEMKSFNDQLDRPNEELRPIYNLLKEGHTLIKKCMKVRWKVWDKHTYSEKLLDLDNRILRFCHVDLVSIIARDVKAGRADVAELTDRIMRLSVLMETDTRRDKDIGRNITIHYKSCAVPQGPDFVVGLDVPFINIKEKLLNGAEPVLIISAAGGYGKTTLVKKLCHDEQVTGKFKDIIFVVVSESPNLMAIVQQIINHLGETVPYPETHSEDDAAQHLQQLLAERGKQNPILLVLDDIWSGSESILEKFVYKQIPNYKVLVTSRFEFPAFGCSRRLKGLEHEDAVKLLRHAATPLIGSCSLPNKDIIDEVVGRCKGSPLALTVVGKSLCGKHKSAWQTKLNEWSNGVSLIGTDESKSEILKCLMNSLKDLDGSEELRRVKEFFLDLGSFPEDHMIPVAVLIDMWSELHNVDGNGVDAVAAIKELSARSLADLIVRREDISVGDGYYNDMYVTQHDLLRDLAIHHNKQGLIEERERLNLDIRKNNLPNWLKEQKQPLKARLLSVCTDEEFSSEWPDLELPAAEVLVLNFRATKNSALPHFIKKMTNLKTLIVANNGYLPVELSNFDLVASLPNLKKIRLEHIKIPFLSMHGLCLNNLEKVSTFHCDISEEIQTSDDLQIHKALPKLEEIDISYCHDLKTLPDGICEAKTLKKISITNCHKLSKLPEEIGNLLELQVLRLNTCTDLERLPGSIVELGNLSFLDISNCISISRLPNQIGRLQQLKELHLNWCSSLSSLPSSVSRLEQLEYLIVDKEQINLRRFFKKPELKLKVGEEDRSLNFLGRSMR